MNTLNKHKLISIILLIFTLTVGCGVISNHNHEKIKGGLSFSNQTIPPHSVLMVSSQNQTPFKAKGRNLSENKISIKNNGIVQTILKDESFDISINQNSSLEFLNTSDEDVKLYFTIYGHQSKINTTTKAL